jgi:cell division inhibitor SepF
MREISAASQEPPGASRESAGSARDFREGGGGGLGGGFSGGGSHSAIGDSGDAYVVFKRLKDFAMATQVAERMTEGKIVILNLESCDDDVARRVLDFIGGVAYACRGLVKRIAGRVFIVTPKGVNADGEFLDEARNAEAQWYDE